MPGASYTFATFVTAFDERVAAHPNALGDAFAGMFAGARRSGTDGDLLLRRAAPSGTPALMAVTAEVPGTGELRRIRIVADPSLLTAEEPPGLLYATLSAVGEAVTWALVPDASLSPEQISALLAASFEAPQSIAGNHLVTTTTNAGVVTMTIDLDTR